MLVKNYLYALTTILGFSVYLSITMDIHTRGLEVQSSEVWKTKCEFVGSPAGKFILSKLFWTKWKNEDKVGAEQNNGQG